MRYRFEIIPKLLATDPYTQSVCVTHIVWKRFLIFDLTIAVDLSYWHETSHLKTNIFIKHTNKNVNIKTKMFSLKIEKIFSEFIPEASTDRRIQPDFLFLFNRFISYCLKYLLWIILFNIYF